jgi:hypothetical protein
MVSAAVGEQRCQAVRAQTAVLEAKLRRSRWCHVAELLEATKTGNVIWVLPFDHIYGTFYLRRVNFSPLLLHRLITSRFGRKIRDNTI